MTNQTRGLSRFDDVKVEPNYAKLKKFKACLVDDAISMVNENIMKVIEPIRLSLFKVRTG
jgi:hypothetical protein